MFRYCEHCDKWLATEEYTVDQSGETVCPEHKAVVGSIQAPINGFPVSDRQFKRQNKHMRTETYAQSLGAAERQGLIE